MLPTPIADPGSQAFIDGELAAEDSEAEADNSTAKTLKRRIHWHPWMDVVLLKEVYARSPWAQNQMYARIIRSLASMTTTIGINYMTWSREIYRWQVRPDKQNR